MYKTQWVLYKFNFLINIYWLKLGGKNFQFSASRASNKVERKRQKKNEKETPKKGRPKDEQRKKKLSTMEMKKKMQRGSEKLLDRWVSRSPFVKIIDA